MDRIPKPFLREQCGINLRFGELVVGKSSMVASFDEYPLTDQCYSADYKDRSPYPAMIDTYEEERAFKHLKIATLEAEIAAAKAKTCTQKNGSEKVDNEQRSEL